MLRKCAEKICHSVAEKSCLSCFIRGKLQKFWQRQKDFVIYGSLCRELINLPDGYTNRHKIGTNVEKKKL